MGLQASGQARTLRFIALACSRWGRFAARLSHSGRCVFSGWRASDLVRATYEQSEFPRIVARWCPQRHSYPLVDLVRAVLERGRRQRQADASRRQVVPCAATCNRWRDQSCKLHVTTTPASATAVLEPSLAVLLRHRCALQDREHSWLCRAAEFHALPEPRSRHVPQGLPGHRRAHGAQRHIGALARLHHPLRSPPLPSRQPRCSMSRREARTGWAVADARDCCWSARMRMEGSGWVKGVIVA